MADDILLHRVNELVNQLNNTTSSNNKINILQQYVNDERVKLLFKYVYNKFWVFGITSKNILKNPQLTQLHFFHDIFELLDVLKDGQATGNQAVALVNRFIECNPQYTQLILNIIDRNLKCNINIKVINKVFNNIPTFEVSLAKTYDINKHDKYGITNDWLIERKCNGLRLISIIEYNNGNPTCVTKSRNGKEFVYSTNEIKYSLLQLYKNSYYFKTQRDVVIDGEACVIKNGKESWNDAISEFSTERNNHVVKNPMYKVFDILTLKEFNQFVVSKEYRQRLKYLTEFLKGSDVPYIQLVEYIDYSQQNVKDWTAEYVEPDIWEGLMFRANVPFEGERTNNLLKFKLWQDQEFRVVDYTVTKDQILDPETGLYKYVDMVGALIVDVDGVKSGVGSGFSNQQAIDWYNNGSLILNKQVTVKFKEMIKNNNTGELKLSFASVVKVWDNDRNV